MHGRVLKTIALAAAAGLLCGCGALPVGSRSAPREAADPYMPEPNFSAPQITPSPDTPADPMGSVGLLSEPTTLVCVYLSDADGNGWSEAEQRQSQQQLSAALDWVQTQCLTYDVQTDIRWGGMGQVVAIQYDGSLHGGEEYEEDAFYYAADEWCSGLRTDGFGTQRVGVLFFLPVSGVDHTMVHYREDGSSYYYEYCCLYKNDWYSNGSFDLPAAYAHEVLHLFGAADLYRESVDITVTPQLSDYVAKLWPNDIMYDIYEPDGSVLREGISKIISPVTAYYLGLADSFEGIEQFPQMQNVVPGVYTEQSGESPETAFPGAVAL